MKNQEIATMLREIADFLEIQEVEYKPRAYRTAARNVESLSDDIEDIHERGELEEIEGVGESIGEKIAEYLETGELEYYEDLKADLPVDIEAITSVEGVGPQTAKKLYVELDVRTLDDLESAAERGEIADLEGFGEKSEQNILDHVERAKAGQERMLLGRASPIAHDIETRLHDADAFDRVDIVGSFRRRRPTVGDIDILSTASDPETAMDVFCSHDDVKEVLSRGDTKSSVVVSGDVQMDLRIVDEAAYGSALVYFTGSKDHNITLRNRAIDRGWKLNEYGLYDVSDAGEAATDEQVGERLASETEAEIYETLDLDWIPPELREDTGEIAAAADGALPDLVEEAAIRGDLHTHTEWSDGRYSIQEMAEAAADRGYAFHAVTDHAAGAGIIESIGLSDADLREQADAIAAVQDTVDIELLHGVETNIEADGSLSTSDDVLEELDVVVASPHSALDQDVDTATERLCRAIEHPAVDIVGHPTGRMINNRAGLPVDFAAVADCAAANDTALEVNANPLRLDLHGEAVRTVVEAGGTIAIDTDAHGPGAFDTVRFGVRTARRGWAEADNVLNTWDIDRLRSFLSRE